HAAGAADFVAILEVQLLQPVFEDLQRNHLAQGVHVRTESGHARRRQRRAGPYVNAPVADAVGVRIRADRSAQPTAWATIRLGGPAGRACGITRNPVAPSHPGLSPAW